jgi:glycosyltransferase involved in cell wall biosynthesis
MADDAPRRRILHVFRAPIGGLFRHVLDLAREQAARGHEVGLFFDSTSENARTAQLLSEVAPAMTLGVTRVPMSRKPAPGDLAVMRRLAAWQRKNAAEVLHGHGSKGGLYARALPRRASGGALRVYTPHGGSFHFRPGDPRHHLYMAAERWLGRRTDLFLFESRYVAQCFASFVGETRRPARIVHNGLHPQEFEPVTPVAERFDLVCIGELLFSKGIDTLFAALSAIRTTRKSAPRLLLVGSGPDEAALRSRCAERDLSDIVSFEPPQPIRAVLVRAHVMVMPSHAESLPYVVLEAAAAGMPLVATNVGGIPEILAPMVQDLVPPQDPSALAHAILDALAQDDEMLASRNAAIRTYLQDNFSVSGMVDGVLDSYAAAFSARAA